LLRWYGLPANRDQIHFAFEKIPDHFDSPTLRWTLALFLGLTLAYAAGYWLLRRAQRLSPAVKLAVVGCFVGPAIVNILLYPVGALDVFNYMIELKLAFHYNENPYVVTFFGYRKDSFALPAFLVDVPLFYGPAWLLFSALPGLVVGYSSWLKVLVGLKLLNVGLLAITALLIRRYYRDERRGWEAVYLFAANPLVLFEGIANAHNDVLMTVWLVAALLAFRFRSASALPLLALSALVKLFAAAVAPLLLLAMLGQYGWRRLWRPVAASGVVAVGVTAALIGPYWAGGSFVDGVREGTVKSQEMDHVSPFSLAQQYVRDHPTSRVAKAVGVPQPRMKGILLLKVVPSTSLSEATKDRLWRYFAAGFAALGLAAAAALLRGRPLVRVAVDVLLLFLLLLTNLYPWYLIPIIALIAMRPARLSLTYLFLATGLGLAYYPAYVYAHFNTGWEPFQVHLFLAWFLTAPILVFLGAEVGWGALKWGGAWLRRPSPRRFAPPLSQSWARGSSSWRGMQGTTDSRSGGGEQAGVGRDADGAVFGD
jgi:hypothetical protein